MLRSDLIQSLNKDFPDLSFNDASHCVALILNAMTHQLAQKGRIEIRDFGNFDLKHHAPRQAHNPKTGEKLVTEAKYAIRFKMGKGLKDRLNA
ncbi:MAG: integration host factor subunit beta [Gammaproteobacteria bacterium]|nr:integration host factor subunit beta [Gammaproteobacteria bacterium]